MGTDEKPGTLTPVARLAYVAAFEAITDGRNRDAAMALRGLDDAQLTELAVICGDVRTMAEAERRRRGGAGPNGERDFTAAMARVDSDPREQQRIQDIADLTEAGDLIYAQALAAIARGDRETAVELLRWCARAGIGESAWLLAEELEHAGEHAEADTWYARAAADGDERAATMILINRGSLGTPAARRIRASADRKAVAEALRRAGIGEPAELLGRLEDVDQEGEGSL